MRMYNLKRTKKK